MSQVHSCQWQYHRNNAETHVIFSLRKCLQTKLFSTCPQTANQISRHFYFSQTSASRRRDEPIRLMERRPMKMEISQTSFWLSSSMEYVTTTADFRLRSLGSERWLRVSSLSLVTVRVSIDPHLLIIIRLMLALSFITDRLKNKEKSKDLID